MEREVRASILAAGAAGAPILLAFFVWHWFRIAPVWLVLVEGLAWLAGTAAAVAWAWRAARAGGRLPAGAIGGLAFGGILAAPLLVYEATGLLRGPTPDPTTVAEVLAELPYALTAVPLLAAAGWALTRTGRGIAAFAVAALVLHLFLGGAIMHAGGEGLALELLLVLLPLEVAAGVILASLEPRLARA